MPPAASAVLASRVGELSLAAELASKTILGLDSVDDDRLIAEVANRLGAFCASLLDYDRAVVQFEIGLAAAEHAEDGYLVCLELYNIANALLLAVRAKRASDPSASLLAPRTARPARAGRAGAGATAGRGHPRAATVPQRAAAAGGAARGHGPPRQALEALRAITNAAGGAGLANDAQKAAFAVVESHCRRDLGQNSDAVAAAERAVQLAQASGDDYELMLTLEERLAAKRAAGDLAGFAADALEVKRLIWAVHQRQTVQIAEQVWERAALERERRQFEEQAAAAVRSAEEDALTCIGNRRRLNVSLTRRPRPRPRSRLSWPTSTSSRGSTTPLATNSATWCYGPWASCWPPKTRPGQVVVRYGGEEFVFAMPGADLAAAAASPSAPG